MAESYYLGFEEESMERASGLAAVALIAFVTGCQDKVGTSTSDLDGKIEAHALDPSAHHEKTVSAAELTTGILDPARLPQSVVFDTDVDPLVASFEGHAQDADAHHAKTTDASEILTGIFDAARIPVTMATDVELSGHAGSPTAHHTKTKSAAELTSGTLDAARLPGIVAFDGDVDVAGSSDQSFTAIPITSTSSVELRAINSVGNGTNVALAGTAYLEKSGANGGVRYELAIHIGTCSGTRVSRVLWRPGTTTDSFIATSVHVTGIRTGAPANEMYVLCARKFESAAVDALAFVPVLTAVRSN